MLGQNYLVSGAVGGSLYVYNLADIIHGDENAGKCNPQVRLSVLDLTKAHH